MDDTERAVLEETYRTLCEYGSADPTIQRIADESELSEAAIHHSDDSRERLEEVLLDYRYERSPERQEGVSGESERDRLDALLTPSAVIA
ncbi:TetR family transcriptional regulator [Halobiforma lacisalsi AJ5]|uniref:TetR family transcriptional regulator n=1 Tax=Natronobacterium lacisalsi AJ5 TaxID=358396 RepID=M0L2U0_NATLA|nr:hypothetical protein [Halobiforma lacisalsi]APW98290.1 TetR family transcriptional regulator [Halobiforma lacisalsi AJ5]EMA27892.1 TetR family transcriptional regulator [Halobiforma lacisalsi AJ5]